MAFPENAADFWAATSWHFLLTLLVMQKAASGTVGQAQQARHRKFSEVDHLGVVSSLHEVLGPAAVVAEHQPVWKIEAQRRGAPDAQTTSIFVRRQVHGHVMELMDAGESIGIATSWTLPPGPAGPPGNPGPIGAPGQDGEAGPPGLQGPRGPSGKQGNTGAKGELGQTGPRGNKGKTGETGKKGPMAKPIPSAGFLTANVFYGGVALCTLLSLVTVYIAQKNFVQDTQARKAGPLAGGDERWDQDNWGGGDAARGEQEVH